MPVGTNGCHHGAESPAAASSERRYPQGIWGYPEQPARFRILSQPADHSTGRACTGTGTAAVRSRDCLDGPGDRSPGELHGPQRDGRGWSAPAWCRDHVSGPGAADRLGLDPGQPSGTRAPMALDEDSYGWASEVPWWQQQAQSR
jgi:hypothetical protein